MDKSILRSTYKHLRKKLDSGQKEAMDQIIINKCIAQIKDYEKVGVYYSFGDEIDTHYLISKLNEHAKITFIPRVEDDKIVMCKFQLEDTLKKSSYGILEPINKAANIEDIDVMIVPMLAFNNEGYRLGYGGGYYDRLLKDYKGLILGLAYDYSLSNDIPIEGHDIKCHRIITDREVREF